MWNVIAYGELVVKEADSPEEVLKAVEEVLLINRKGRFLLVVEPVIDSKNVTYDT